MDTKTKKENSPPPDRKLSLFSLTWPIFVGTILFMLLGFVDVLVLSRYDDLAASGVSTANQATVVLTIVFTVFSSAGGIIISQYLGAGKKDDASRAAAVSLAAHLTAGIIVSIALIFFSNALLAFIGAKGQVFAYAQKYLSIVGGFIFIQAAEDAMTGIMRSHGITKQPMIIAFFANLLNTTLDIILVPSMGVEGVAIATVICRSLEAVVLAVLLFTKIEKISIFRFLIPFPFKEIKLFFKLGIPSALETFLYNMSQLVITSIVLIYLTEPELIAKTYIQNISLLFYVFALSVGQASQIIIGHLVGAGKYEEARKKGLYAYRIALIVTLVMSVTGIILRVPIMSMFTSNQKVIDLTALIMIINLFLEFGRTTNLVIISCLRGAGDVFFPTACAIFSNWVLSVGGAYLLAVVLGMGIYGLWIAIALDECFRGVLMIFRWHGSRWQKSIIKKT